ncbi:MAG: hypothetical protein Q8Q60_02290 [Candidatus Chromulinivorax sp.]|jgi:hypothetical protein|nr:hypothetical protein [Candidatus Chromulinivorax sp.]
MYKKFMVTGLFLLSTWSMFTIDETSIPYESLIAKEYNAIRSGANRYSSFDTIMNQSLRGKSVEQKSKIVADLKALKFAIHTAYNKAEHDGKSLWYYGYIWKDNNPAIQSLLELESEVAYKIKATEMELQSDITRFLLYITPFASGILAGITLLWLAQSNLSYDYYVENKQHGLLEMFQAPTIDALKATGAAIKVLLMGASKAAEGVKYSADTGASLL